jgi:hypothetical protein
MGVVEEICVCSRAGGSIESRASVAATRGVGLAGDRYAARQGFGRTSASPVI